MTLCKCGCGQEVTTGKRFVIGHHNKHRSEESIKKQIETLKRLKYIKEVNRKINEELKMKHKKRMSELHKGRTVSEETRKKISIAQKGKIVSDKTRRKISKGNKGKHKGKIINEETRKKISKSNKGQKRSKETRKKLSETHKGEKCYWFGRTGENAPNWQGGIRNLPYCHKFNFELKEAVRNRDNRTCQHCNKPENSRRHTIHHIHYDKENCYPDLITLCSSCNGKANGNKDYWETYYMNKLNDRNLLFWTRRNDTKYKTI